MLQMQASYFVKFIGEKHVAVAKATTPAEAQTLRDNQYEETTADFYRWIQRNTRKIG